MVGDADLNNVFDSVLGRVDPTAGQALTDASAFGQCHIPTLVLGPGNIAQAHTADEFIEIDQLAKGLAVYQTFLDGDWGI